MSIICIGNPKSAGVFFFSFFWEPFTLSPSWTFTLDMSGPSPARDLTVYIYIYIYIIVFEYYYLVVFTLDKCMYCTVLSLCYIYICYDKSFG